MTTKERCAEIDTRLSVLPAGPWQSTDQPTDACCWTHHVETTARMGTPDAPAAHDIADVDSREVGVFIAHAREDLPWAIAQIRALTEEVKVAESVKLALQQANDRLRAALKEHGYHAPVPGHGIVEQTMDSYHGEWRVTRAACRHCEPALEGGTW